MCLLTYGRVQQSAFVPSQIVRIHSESNSVFSRIVFQVFLRHPNDDMRIRISGSRKNGCENVVTACKRTVPLLIFALALLLVSAARANVSITAATGGSGVSADTAANAPSPAWTTLGPITITEGTNADFSTGTNVTLILSVPSGFQFNTAVTPDTTFTAGQDITSASVSAISSTNLTVTLTVAATVGVDSLTIGGTTGLQVRPTVTTPLSTGRHIYRPSSGGGTATIKGISTSSSGSSGSDFGDLSEAAGAPAVVRVETSANGSGSVVATQNVSAGNSLTVYSIVRDAYGNFVTNAPADSWSLINLTGGVANSDLVASTNLQSAVFTGHLPGTAVIQANLGSLTPTDSGTLTVVYGPATKLFVVLPGETFTSGVGNSGTPLTQTVGVPFTITALVAIDNLTNIATSYSGAKTISYNGPGGSPTYTTSVSFTNGQSTTPLVTTLVKAETTNIAANVSGLTAVRSSTLTVIPATGATQLQLLAPGETAAPGTASGKTGTPTAQPTGYPFNVTVRAVDAYWNLISTVSDTVGLTSSDASAVLPPSAPLAGGTLSLPVTLVTIGSRTLTATDLSNGSVASNTSAAINVTAGPFVQLQTLLPGETNAPGTPTGRTGTPLAQTAGAPFTVTVNAVDTNWNVVASASGYGYSMHVTSSDTNATLPSNANLSSGTKTFSVTLKTAGTATVTASDASDGTKTPGTSSAVTVNSAAFSKLQVLVPGETAAPGAATGKTGSPLPQAAVVPFNITVNAVDANWNPINTNDTVHLTSTDVLATLPPDAPLNNGSQTFTVTLNSGGTRTITASDVTQTNITANTSAPIFVTVGNFAQLQVLMPGQTAAPGTATGKTGTATNLTAGTAFTVTVWAVDANWNPIPTNDIVSLSSSDGAATMPTNAALVNGTKTFSVTLKTAGSQTITAADVTNPGIGANTGSAATVNAGSASKLVIAAQPSATATVGVPFAQQPVIYVEDAYSNIRSNDTNTVVTAARSSGSGTLQGTTAMTAFQGVVTYTNLAHPTATNITIRFTGSGLTSATSSVVSVTSGTFSRLLVLLPGQSISPGSASGTSGTASVTAGTNTAVTVIATDIDFNPIPGISDTVSLTCTDTNAILPVAAALTNGTNTFPLTVNSSGSRSIIATDVSDGSKTPYTNTVNVSAGPFVQLQLLVPGELAAPGTPAGMTGSPLTQTSAVPFSVTANAVDANWNVVSSASGSSYTVGITASDTNAILPSNANLSSGTRSFNVTLWSLGAWTVTASDLVDTNKTASTSPNITVVQGGFSKLQVLMPGESAAPGTPSGKTGTPLPQSAGTPFTVTVNAVDPSWNLIGTNDTVHFASSDHYAALPADLALVGGSATVGVTLNTAGNQTVTASDVTQTNILANVSAVTTNSAGAFAKLQLLMPGETAAPGSATGVTGTPSARTAGSSFNITVNAVDALWNIVSTNHTVGITSSDANATMPTNAALSSGSKTFSVTLKTGGAQTVTATDITDGTKSPATSPATVVNAGTCTKMQLLVPGETAAPGGTTGKSGTPNAQTSSVAFAVTVNAVDANWNLVSTAPTNTIKITATDTNAILPANAALASGTESFNVSLVSTGLFTLTATNVTDGTKTSSTSPPITSNPAPSKTNQSPTVQPLSLAGSGAVVITWTAVSNTTYRVQYETGLNAGGWVDLSPNVTATGPTASYTDNSGAAGQRFYRVLVVQ